MGIRSEVVDTVIRNSILDNCTVKTSTLASTVARIPKGGTTILSSTAAATMVMEAPVAGIVKRLVKSSTSTAVLTITSPTTTVTFNATGNTNALFDAADDMIELLGLSTTRWLIIANSNATFS